MKRMPLLAVVIAAMAAPLVGHSTPPPGDVRAKLDQYMNAAASVEHFMGAVLVARGDHVILARGYGKADRGKDILNTADTEFQIGSVTKQFTAMAILMLQAEGKLKTSDHVCPYVPDCPKDWQPITIAMLLTHTSGIPDYLDTLASKPAALMKLMATAKSPSQLVALFKDKPLDFKPGAKFRYSNSGYVLLGYILQRVSGQHYGTFLRRHIFDRLGMTNSGYANHHASGKALAQGYRYANGHYQPSSPVNLTSAFSAGGIRSTVRDLYTWDRALDADAGKLIPPSLHKKMFTPHVRVGGKLAQIQGIKGDEYYGFGWFIKHQFGHLEYSHEGGIPGFTSLNSWFPESHVYIVVLDNMQSPDVFRIGKDLAAIVFGKPYSVPRPFKAISLPAQALQKFTGMYELEPGRYITVTREGSQLEAQLTGQPAIKIYPESATHFFYKVVRAQIFFQTNAQGEVTGLVLHQHGAKLPAKKLSPSRAKTIEANQAASAPTVISLPASTLRAYVCTYRMTPNFAITITRKGDQLWAQATGQHAFKIYPESRTEFFPKAFKAKITFVMDKQGKVAKLILHQAGREMPAQKVR